MENQLNELKKFLREYNIPLDSEQIDDKRNRCTITFRIQNLESYFFNSQNPSEIVFGKGVEIRMIFSLDLSLAKPRLQVIGENQPFHPHFSTNDTIFDKFSKKVFTNRNTTDGGEWIDYKLHQTPENIVSFLKRVILSLQFHKDCIDITLHGIANSKAKEWYLVQFQRDSSQFPTGTLFRKKFVPKEVNQNSSQIEANESQVQNSSTDSKFETREKKKFEVNQQINNEPSSKKFEVKTSYKKKKFQITEETQGYAPSEKAYIEVPTDQSLDSIVSNQTESNVKIFITEEVQNQIWSHIGWGERINRNIVEQGGILLGQVYKDLEQKIQFAVVEKAIAGWTAKGSSAYLEMGHEVWKEMIEMVDNYLDANPNYNIQIIGWYHTHPNSLDVFMSGTDRNTQSLHFSKNWHYAIVLNPHRQIWKAFYGKNAIECEGKFLHNSNITPPFPSESKKASENIEKEPPQKNEEIPPPISLPEGKKEHSRKKGNYRTLLLILIILVLSVAVANLLKNNDKEIPLDGNTEIMVKSDLSTPPSNLSEIDSKDGTVIDTIEKSKFNTGDTIRVQKGLKIFSNGISKVAIASFQNEFDIILTNVDSNFLFFEKELFVGNYDIRKDTSLIYLKNAAKLKTQKVPQKADGEKESIFAISEKDSSLYSIINEDKNGWLKFRYTGSININDIQKK